MGAQSRMWVSWERVSVRVRVRASPSSLASLVVSSRSSSRMVESVDRQSELSLLNVSLMCRRMLGSAPEWLSRPLPRQTEREGERKGQATSGQVCLFHCLTSS